MTILVGTTLAAFAMDDEHTWGSWCSTAEAMRAEYDKAGHDRVFPPAGDTIEFFCAIQVDARGLEPFAPLLDRLEQIGASYWTYSLDDGRTQVNSANRLRHLTMGENLVSDYCCADPTISHLLFMAADTQPPADCLQKLLDVRWPIVGGEIPGYCLHGPTVERHPVYDNLFGYPVESHTPSVAFVLLNREVFRRVKWRWDLDAGEGDDPCMYRDTKEHLGYEALVRKDVIGRHYPECLVPIEHRGHDMTVHRGTTPVPEAPPHTGDVNRHYTNLLHAIELAGE